MKSIGIIGLGLIGGSIAKAIKRHEGYTIKAFNRSQPSLDLALNDGVIIDGSTTDLNILADCDVIFICTPVGLIPSYVERLLPIIKRDCVITDVGSTKKHIFDEMLKFGNKINFIGGHPMAGSEKTSYSSAKPYLLENAYYIVAPSPTVDKKYVSKFEELVRLTGALPIIVDPSEHDYAVAAISHVPHIIAASLVNTVKQLDSEKQLMHMLAAGGFKDITRIASSSPEVWSSICTDNRGYILNVIKAFQDNLAAFARAVEQGGGELNDSFASARDYRNSFSSQKAVSYAESFELYVDIAEKPGIMACITTILSFNGINIKSIGVVNNREYADGILQIVLESKSDKDKCRELLTQMNYTVYDK